MSDDERCGAATKGDGSPCPTPVALCSECGHCRSHCDYSEACDYDEQEVRESRSRGAKAANAKARDDGRRTVPGDEAPPAPQDLDDAQYWAAWAAVQVATGNVDEKTGRAVGYLVRAFMDAAEKAELNRRVQEIEERLEAARQRGDLEVMN